MATNNFKPFATAANANVTAQADWESLPALLSGFTAGKASSAQVNKAIRQASFIAAALAQYTAKKSGLDVLDDGDLNGFIAKMSAAFGKDFQALDATLTALAGLTTGANKLPYFTGTDTASQTDLTSVGRDIIGKGTIADILTYLGLRGGVRESAIGRLVGVKVFTSSAQYIPTDDASFAIYEVQGGGGGGGGSYATTSGNASVGGGGTSGNYVKGKFDITKSSYVVTVGAGGAGGAIGSNGLGGGESSIDSFARAGGGYGGVSMTAGSTAFMASTDNSSQPSPPALVGGNICGIPYGSGFNVSLRLSGSVAISGSGGESPFGGGGGHIGTGSGADAVGFGAGGAGATSVGTSVGYAGAKGANGVVIIWEYA